MNALWVQLGKQKKMRKEKDVPPLSRRSLKLRCTVGWMESWLDFGPTHLLSRAPSCSAQGAQPSVSTVMPWEKSHRTRGPECHKRKGPANAQIKGWKTAPYQGITLWNFSLGGKGVILQLLERNKAKQKWRRHMDRIRFQKGSRRLNSNFGSFQVSSDSGATYSGS